jgi:uncharacterized protein (TIGR03790 family)
MAVGGRRAAWPTAALVAALAAAAPAARAGGGPRNVLVVANERSPESLDIATYYRRARGIPVANLCRVQASTALSTSKALYQGEIEAPVLGCIAASPYAERIDYVVLGRGLPIRAAFPGGQVATTALLQAMDTPLRDKDQEDPGFLNHPNPYRHRLEYFAHGKAFGPRGYHLYLATMLSGYWTRDALALVDRSLASDGVPPSAAGGVCYLEDGAPAADVRNGDFPRAVGNLAALGVDAVHVLASDPGVTGQAVAAHVNSGSYSGIGQADIESNRYPPGAIVDVFESFGLVPQNFDPAQGGAQTPATWWVTAGATGVHGTVAEPYNVAFPDGFLLEPYVQGYNLAETFYQGIPYLYWMNLVLGDPLAAPWAVAPAVRIDAPADGDTVRGVVPIRASATTSVPEGIFGLDFFAADQLVGRQPFGAGQVSWDTTALADGWYRIEVVAFENTLRLTQSTAGIDLRVDNRGHRVDIVSPAGGTQVGPAFPVEVSASAGIDQVRLVGEGLDLAQAGGVSPFTVDVDSSRLGRGWNRLWAEGSGPAGAAARSFPVDLYVVKAPEPYDLAPTEGPQSGGTVVAIRGFRLEPEARVWFGEREALVAWDDVNHLEATSPTGPPGPVDVRIVNPLGLELVLASAFTYLAAPCPATDEVGDLKLVRPAPGTLGLAWAPSSDPCFASYRVFAATDPAAPPAFPGDFADLTALDQDGDPGGDPSFAHAEPAADLVLYRVAAQGTDGTLGP